MSAAVEFATAPPASFAKGGIGRTASTKSSGSGLSGRLRMPARRRSSPDGPLEQEPKAQPQGRSATIGGGGGRGLRRNRSLESLSSLQASLGNRSVASIASFASSLTSNAGGKAKNKDKAPDTVDSLLRRRKWRRLAKHLGTDQGRSEVLSSSTSCALTADDGDGLNALHRACRAGAPLDVVKSLCSICPDLAVEVDPNERTALHLAVLPRAEPMPLNAIFYLMNVHGGAVSMRDKDGRLPLHLACCRGLDDMAEKAASNSAGGGMAEGRRNSGSKKKGGKIRFEVVQALCNEAPFAVNEEDAAGHIPLELACDEHAGGSGDLPGSVLWYLVRVSDKRWRRKMRRESALRASLNMSLIGGSDDGSGNEDNQTDCREESEKHYEQWKARRTAIVRASIETHAAHRRARKEGASSGDPNIHYELGIDMFLGEINVYGDEDETEEEERNHDLLYIMPGKEYGEPHAEDVPVDIRERMERRVSDLSTYIE